MSLRKMFRSSTSVTIVLLFLPFFLLSVSTYCGDDVEDDQPDTGPTDTGPTDGPPDDTNDLGPDPDLAGVSGTCCWGHSEFQQCAALEGDVCTGTFSAGGECSAAPCPAPTLIADSIGDLIDSISSAIATYVADHIDIVGYGAWIYDLSAKMSRDLFNIQPLISCSTDTADTIVACVPNMMGGPTPMSFGNMLIATMELAADVPLADPDNSFIYTLALESDGDSTNDWQYVDPYDNDTFQGTDRWYSLKWNHVQQRWSVEVIQVDANQQQNEELSSSVRIVVKGKNITFYISMEEIPGDPPKYRLVAFGHDGNYSPSHRGADTSTDPKAALPDVKK